MRKRLFLNQDYSTTGFASFFTLEISVSLEFVQMVFHTIRSQIKDRSQSLTGQVWILGEQVQNLFVVAAFASRMRQSQIFRKRGRENGQNLRKPCRVCSWNA